MEHGIRAIQVGVRADVNGMRRAAQREQLSRDGHDFALGLHERCSFR
jgi:hypothetical protein